MDTNQALWAAGGEAPRYSGTVFGLLALRRGFAARRWGDVPAPPPQYPAETAEAEPIEYVLL